MSQHLIKKSVSKTSNKKAEGMKLPKYVDSKANTKGHSKVLKTRHQG